MNEIEIRVSLNRVGFTGPFQQWQQQATRGAQNTRQEMRRAFQGMADDAEQAGEDTGERLWRSADGRLRDSRGRFARAGRQAGEAFSDGVEDGAERGGFGMGLLGRFAGGLTGRFKEMLAPVAAGGLALAAFGTTAASAAPLLVPVVTGLADIGSAALAAAPALVAAKAGVKILAFSFLELFKEQSAALVALMPLKKGWEEAGKAGSNAAARGIRPLVDELRKVAQPVVTKYMVGLGEAANIAEKRFLSWGKSTEGIKALKGILFPLSDSMKELAPHVADVAIAFTKMLGRIMGVSAAAGTSGLAKVLDLVADKLDTITAKSVQGGFDKLTDTFWDVVGAGKVLVGWVEKIVTVYRLYTTEFRLLADAVSVAAIAFGGPVVAAVGAAGLIIRHFDDVKGAWQDLKEAFSHEPPEVFHGFLNHMDEITSNVSDTWEKLKDLFRSVFDDLKEWFDENKEQITGWGNEIGSAFEDLTATISEAVTIIQELWDRWGDDILEISGIVIDALVKNWAGLFESLRGVFEIFSGLIQGDWSKVWEGIKHLAKGFNKQMESLSTGLLKLLWKLHKVFWDLIVDVVTGAFGALVKQVRRGFDRLEDLARSGLKSIRNLFRDIWNSLDDIVDRGMRSVRRVVDGALDGVMAGFRRFWRGARDAFSSGVSAIGRAMNGIRNATKNPVKFVVDVVYNSGIRPVWNFVAGIAGMDKLPKLNFEDGGIIDLRLGGKLPGFSRKDNRLVMARDGEGVLTPEATGSLGENFIHTANRAGRRARDMLLGGDPSSVGGNPLQGYAGGGIIGGLKSALKNGADFLKNAPGLLVNKGITAWAKHLLEPALSGSAGGAGWWGQAIRQVPGKMAGNFLTWVKSNLEDLFGGGGDFGKALAWARTQDGLPYQWATRDCSWFMSAIESVIRGESPHRRWATASFLGGTPPGWHQNMASNFRIGISHAGVGHTAGTLMGVNVESSGSGGVRVGGEARGANDPMFPYHYGFKADNGAVLRPGWNRVFNGTNALEELRPVTQMKNAITSSNRVFADIGADIADSIAKGMRKNTNLLQALRSWLISPAIPFPTSPASRANWLLSLVVPGVGPDTYGHGLGGTGGGRSPGHRYGKGGGSLPRPGIPGSKLGRGAVAAGGAGEDGVLRLELEWVGGNGGDALMQFLRDNIRVRAGTGPNSVQNALGGG